MKLIKKIAAIMFAFMMVVSMSCNVKADDATTTTGETGTITINNAVDGQTYTIYKLLDLESYEPKKNEQGEEIGNYSYKPNKDWNNFISTAIDSAGNNYFDVDENGYARWNVDKTKTAEFAQKALAYAKDEAHPIVGVSSKKEEGKNLEFTNLSLGYYLVDSSVGALCSLDTTNPSVTIKEKNGVPSVEKKIVENNTDVDNNFANIGETVYFKTTITAQKGAQTYVLHDIMDKGLTFNNNVKVKISGKTEDLTQNQDYELITNPTDKTCTFEIKFKDTFLKTINGETKIEVTYSATLNGDAEIHNNNDNTTHLTYGENNNTTTSTTNTITYGINVLKYTGDTTNTLAEAKFSLYDNETGGTVYNLVQKTGTTDYRLAMTGESGITEITTTDTGKFSIQGLKPGTYWLEETAAPKGYNKLAKRIKVEIISDGTYKINNKTQDNGLGYNSVDVENKTGTVLPSTGGAGTTMIYLVGAVLVLGSGVVLATKRRVKGK